MSRVSRQPHPPLARPAFAIAAFFSLLPAVAAGGAIGLPLLIGLTSIAALQPWLLTQAIGKIPLLLGLLAAFAIWAAASSLWSPWSGATWAKTAATLGLGLLFAAAITSAPRIAMAGGLAALVVLVVVLAIEATANLPLTAAGAPDLPASEQNKIPAKGVVVMLALVWPGLAWVLAARTRWSLAAAASLALATGFVSLQFGQLSTAIGFGAGLAFFLFAFVLPRVAILATAGALALWVLVSPVLTPIMFASQTLVDALPHSWAARVGIWRYTCERILERPWIGHGLDAGRATTEYATYDGELMRVIPVHPHSASLQIWYETGLIGALLASALIALTGQRLARAFATNKPASAAAAAVLAMLGLMANVGWSLWQEWWMATLILAGALVAAVGARGATK